MFKRCLNVDEIPDSCCVVPWLTPKQHVCLMLQGATVCKESNLGMAPNAWFLLVLVLSALLKPYMLNLFKPTGPSSMMVAYYEWSIVVNHLALYRISSFKLMD